MKEVYRLLYLLGLDASSVTPEEDLEITALRELMRQRSRGTADYHLSPRGQALLSSANANDSR